MKLADYRNPEDALEPFVDAIEAAMKEDLHIEGAIREKTSGATEMELRFDGDATTYIYVTIESDNTVSFTVGWYAPEHEDVSGAQEMQNVSADTDIKDAVERIVRRVDDYCYVTLCRGCGREIGISGENYCQSCDNALRDDAAEAEQERRREEGDNY